jgi:hypothetical protein
MAAERNKNPRSTGIFAWYVKVQNNTQSQEILGDEAFLSGLLPVTVVRFSHANGQPLLGGDAHLLR